MKHVPQTVLCRSWRVGVKMSYLLFI